VQLLKQLRQWSDKTLQRPINSDKLKKAVTYLHNQWPKLIRYTEKGAWPIDNNAAENAIRPMVIGRNYAYTVLCKDKYFYCQNSHISLSTIST
jgi:hypothetical protein